MLNKNLVLVPGYEPGERYVFWFMVEGQNIIFLLESDQLINFWNRAPSTVHAVLQRLGLTGSNPNDLSWFIAEDPTKTILEKRLVSQKNLHQIKLQKLELVTDGSDVFDVLAGQVWVINPNPTVSVYLNQPPPKAGTVMCPYVPSNSTQNTEIPQLA